MMSSIWPMASPERCCTSRTTTSASSRAVVSRRVPLRAVPSAVRAPATMTASSFCDMAVVLRVMGSAEGERIAGLPAELDPDGLGLGEVLDGLDAVLAADAARTHAAERDAGGDGAVGVDPDGAGAES